MSVEHNKNERRRILELSSPQSSGRTKMKVQLTPLRKIRSKLTSKLNNRSYEENNLSDVEIDSNRATCSSGCDEFNTFSVFQNVSVSLYYYLNDETVHCIEILISEDKTIAEFIKFSIEKINEELKKNKSTFYIDEVNVKKYSIREVKKSGKPNYDLPIFNNSTTLQNCKEDKFALTWDDQAQSHIIYEQKNEINMKPHHKKKDMKELTIKKYRINKENCNVDKDRLCIIY